MSNIRAAASRAEPCSSANGQSINHLLVYFTLAVIQLFVHARIVDSPYINIRRAGQALFLAKLQAFPFQYRILPYLQAVFLQHWHVSFLWSYLIGRGLWLFAAACLIHRFFIRYLPKVYAMLGVVFIFSILPLSYVDYTMQETDPANLAFFTLGYSLIAARSDRWLTVLLGVSMLNRETPILLPLAWLMYRWDELPWLQVLLRFGGFMAVALAVYGGLHLYYGNVPSELQFWNLSYNSRDIWAYLFPLLWVGALLQPALAHWREKPKFLRRASLFIPFFVAFHWCVGLMEELRYLLPVLPLVLALALTSWKSPSGPGPEPAPDHRLLWLPRALPWIYAASLAAFCALTPIYNGYLQKTHIRIFAPQNRIQWHLRRGILFADCHAFKEAEEEWQQGLKLDPNDVALNANLARLYTYFLPNKELAEQHARRAHAMAPRIRRAVQ